MQKLTPEFLRERRSSLARRSILNRRNFFLAIPLITAFTLSSKAKADSSTTFEMA